MVTSLSASRAFEQDVRRIARELFPRSGGYSGVLALGRERDGVLDDGETIHIIEATCDPTKRKAEGDLQKSVELKKELQRQYTDRNFKIWFITEIDPTADQAAVVLASKKQARCPVVGLSLAAFAQRLVDARGYLMARENYSFGSVRNLTSGTSSTVPENEFIPLGLVNTADSEVIQPDTLTEQVSESGGIYVISGDFGAGKSMTARHMFRRLSDKVLSASASRFPIFLNLRDHVGQDDPASALYDHGRRLGFTPPEALVRAWRAGFVHMFLDGFDEISSSRFRADVKGLRAVRFRAMRLLREFVENHPQQQAGLVITGRENYFGNSQELRTALGLEHHAVKMLSLTEFTTEQVQSYLLRVGLDHKKVPDWLPSRPLLLGYLAVKGAFSSSDTSLTALSRAEGWDYLLDRICEREGRQIEDLGGDAGQVRRYIERLATRARTSTSGRGPIPASELDSIFRQIFPSTPDEAAQQLLLRMAGLTAAATPADPVMPTAPDQEDAREFIDNDFVNAARAGDVVRFVEHPYDEDLIKLFSDPNCICTMSELGVEVAAHKSRGFATGKIHFALKRAANDIIAPTIAIDIINEIRTLGMPITDKSQPAGKIVVRGAYIPTFEFSSGIDLSGIEFHDCLFDQIIVDRQDGAVRGPRMVRSMVDQAQGVVSREDVPQSIIDEATTIDSYVLVSDLGKEAWKQALPAGTRVLLASLHKLFVQAGRARKENAFPRGLDDSERPYVTTILSLLQKYSFAYPQRIGGPPLWIPNRVMSKDAMAILRAPQESTHGILKEAREL